MPDTHPNLPLEHDWDAGENVKSGMDANLRLLGAVVQLAVESRTSDEPGTPSDGDRYIHNGGTWSVGNAGDVIARIAGAWYAYTPADGWLAKCRDEERWIEYQGAGGAWVGFAEVLHNDSATSDPTATDDSDAGYSAGSRWYNTNSGELFRCVDATVGSAEWRKTTLTLDELGNAAVADFASTAEHEAGTSTSKVANPAGVHAAFNQYGLGGAFLPGAGDLNDLVTSGLYKSEQTGGYPPASNGFGEVIVLPYGAASAGGTIVQWFIENSTMRTWARRTTDGGSTWDAWVEHLDENHLAANGGNIVTDDRENTLSADLAFDDNKHAIKYVRDLWLRESAWNAGDFINIRGSFPAGSERVRFDWHDESAGTDTTLGYIHSDGSFVWGNPSGSNAGPGIVNAEEVQDDGTTLTDYVFDGEIDGAIDTAFYDNAVPNRTRTVTDGEEEVEEEVEVTQPVDVPRDEWDEEQGCYVRRIVTEQHPVYDTYEVRCPDTGECLGTKRVRRTERKPVMRPKQVEQEEVRTHDSARAFDLTELDPAAFAQCWQTDRKLPALKRLEERSTAAGKSKSGHGETIQSLIETCEAQAVHIERLRQRIDALENGQ